MAELMIPGTKRGKCEMCGEPDRDLWMLFVGDYAGYTCSECIDRTAKCQQRRFTSSGEETEPAE